MYCYLCDSAQPEITVVKEPFSKLVVGQRVILTCIATSPRLLRIRWSKDGDGDYGAAVIGDYARTGIHSKVIYAYCYLYCNFQIDIIGGDVLRTVVYFDAFTEAQQDVYRCTAENIAGISYEKINLILLV